MVKQTARFVYTTESWFLRGSSAVDKIEARGLNAFYEIDGKNYHIGSRVV